jgi:transcriptional repressor NrdR
MKCPACGQPDTRVINSRPANDGTCIRRRRICDACGERFTTFETIEKPQQSVLKRNGDVVPYSRDRLRRGIEKACRKRPVTAQQIDTMITAIEREVFKGNRREVSTETLGMLVLKRLKELDVVAYLRFASVYKEFRDLQDFNSEIKSLLKD